MKYRKDIRLKGYNYKNDGFYFVTICCSYITAKHAVSENVAAEAASAKYVAAERSSANSKANTVSLQSNEYHLIIGKYLKNLEKYQGVKLDYYQIMSNHLHIILILNNSNKSLSQLIQDFKSKSTLEIKNNGFSMKRFWQPNYYEHVIRNEKALEKIREYIINNPLAEKLEWDKIYNEIQQKCSSRAKLC